MLAFKCVWLHSCMHLVCLTDLTDLMPVRSLCSAVLILIVTAATFTLSTGHSYYTKSCCDDSA
jgi:hypothetical protein